MATFDIADFGAIADTTGTISVNSNQLTVANSTGWTDGSRISVDGAGAGRVTADRYHRDRLAGRRSCKRFG